MWFIFQFHVFLICYAYQGTFYFSKHSAPEDQYTSHDSDPFGLDLVDSKDGSWHPEDSETEEEEEVEWESGTEYNLFS